MHVSQRWGWQSPGAPKQLTIETLEPSALGDREVLIENHRKEVGMGSCFVHCESLVSSFATSGLRSMEG